MSELDEKAAVIAAHPGAGPMSVVSAGVYFCWVVADGVHLAGGNTEAQAWHNAYLRLEAATSGDS